MLKIVLFTGFLLVLSTAEDATNRTQLKPITSATSRENGKTILYPISNRYKKEAPSETTETPSLLSKLTSWIFPFGGKSDSQTSETETRAVYGPPPAYTNNPGHHLHHHQQQQEDCNPCNEVPWVPVHNAPSKTVIGFVPPAQYNSAPLTSGDILTAPSVGSHDGISNFGASQTLDTAQHIETISGSPAETYGPPQGAPSNSYGPPQGAPSNSYGPPQGAPSNSYGPPQGAPSNSYGPPQGAPSNSYNLPQGAPSNSFGPPQIPPSNNFLPPSPSNQLNQFGPPANSYGPPNHDSFGSSNQQFGSASHDSFASNIKHTYGPPRPIKLPYPPQGKPFGPPGGGGLRDSYGVPYKPHDSNVQGLYAPMYAKGYLGGSNQNSHLAKPNKFYGPPISRPPKNYFGPPLGGPNYPPRTPLGKYTGPSSQYGPPKLKIPPPTIQYPPKPGPSKYIPLKPNIFSGSLHPPSTHFGIPSSDYRPQHAPSISINAQYGPPPGPQPTPYSPTKFVTPTSDEYIPPPQQLPISLGSQEQQETSIVHIPIYDNGNGQFLKPPIKPIPFPQLNPIPLPPLHNAQPFYPPLENSGKITAIEIHDNTNGNLQHLANIPPELPNVDVIHTQHIQQQGSYSDDVANFHQHLAQTHDEDLHSHHDTSISESVGQTRLQGIDGILVPPPQPQYTFANDQLTTEVKLVQSIPIAEYTSSIEYPANIAQSPIVDIIAGETQPRHPDEDNHVSTDHELNTAEASNHNEDNFASHPIIVDETSSDSQSSASSHNLTLHESQNLDESHHTDDEDANSSDENKHDVRDVSTSEENPGLSSHSNHNYGIITAGGIVSGEQPILYLNYNPPQKSAKEFNFVDGPIGQFIQPTIDYSSWAPSTGPLSTSMLPPSPNAEGFWVTPTPSIPTIPEKAPEGMVPPPPPSEAKPEDDAKNTKHIQIIIPYTSNSRPTPFQNPGQLVEHGNWFQEQQAFLNGQAKLPETTNLLPLPSPPLEQSLLWLIQPQNDINFNQQASQHVPQIDTSYIQNNFGVPNENVPFDILRLQHNIDDWTAQEYSENLPHEGFKSVTSGQLVPSKKIPNEYLTTTALTNEVNEPTERSNRFHDNRYHDHESAGSIRHSYVHTNLHNVTIVGKLNNTRFESSLIIPEATTVSEEDFYTTTDSSTTFDDHSTTESSLPETTLLPTTVEDYEGNTESTPFWEQTQVDISPVTKEKIYVVTPQPYNANEATPASAWNHTPKSHVLTNQIDGNDDEKFNFHSPRFLVRPTPASAKSSVENGVKIIYSEWPQSINNLETTTSTSKSGKSGTQKSFLWGLMDLTPYTPPPGSGVETYSGHSKVVTAVTPSVLARKKAAKLDEKKLSLKNSVPNTPTTAPSFSR